MSEAEGGQAHATLGYSTRAACSSALFEPDRNAPDHDHMRTGGPLIMYRRHLLKSTAAFAVAGRKTTPGRVTKAPDCIFTSTVTFIRPQYVAPPQTPERMRTTHNSSHSKHQSTDNARDRGPTAESIVQLRSLLPLPQELITMILDLAEYWVCRSSTLHSHWIYDDGTYRHLSSPPIPRGSDFLHPLRRVVVTIESWNSHKDTWFELTVDEPGGDSDERVRVKIASNIQGIDYTEHRIVIEDKRVLSAALGGDKVSIWATSPRPRWINGVKSVKIEMYVAY